MASPESLLKDLATETLTGEITALKAKVDELSVQLTQAQRDKEELQAAQSQSKQKTDELERHKSAVELKLNDLTNSKQESMAIINDLRQTLAVERSDKAKLAQEAKDNYIKWIKSQGDKEGEHYQNEALKLQLQTVQAQLSTMEQQHANIRHALLAAETEVQLANDAKRRERAQARSDKTAFEKQEALLSSSVEQLRLELRQCQLDKDSAEDRARHAEERSSKLEISLAATNKSHADVVKVFERQRNDADDQIARFSAELEAAQEQAGLKNKQLIEENAELKKQLQEVNDRLAVMRSCVDQQLGKSPGNEQTAPASPGNNQSAQPLLGGRLLEEMKKYESTGRYWDDIFSDFFKLKEANDRLTKMNKELTAVNRDYMREKDNSYGYYTRLEAEVERLRINQTAHTNAVQELAKLKASQQEQHLAQKKQLDDLARDKQDVEASLNDTSYQLRYLLRYVQFQYGALPPKLQETGDLLDDAQIPPTLDHDDIVFKDFDEMQQRNQQFMSDVRRLKADVLQKSQEIDQLQAELSDKQAQLDNAFGQSTSVIRDQREKLEALEYRLSLTVAERDRLQQLVGASSMDMTSHVAVQPDVADKLAQSEQKVQDLTAEMEAYHQEVELEMAEIRGELKQIHGDARQLRDDLSKTQAERDQLQARNRDLLHIADQRLAEVHAMRQRETVQDGRIDDLETRLTAANAEASDLTRQLETLRATSMTTEAQLKGYEQSYERLCLENKELAHERANLTTLLQSMNENLGNATGSTAHVVQELRAHNERLTRELDHLRDRLNAKENEVRALQAVDQHEWRDKYQAATGEVKQLTTNCLEIEKQLAAATQDRILAQTKLSEVSRELQKLQQQQTGSGDATAPAEAGVASHARALRVQGPSGAGGCHDQQGDERLCKVHERLADPHRPACRQFVCEPRQGHGAAARARAIDRRQARCAGGPGQGRTSMAPGEEPARARKGRFGRQGQDRRRPNHTIASRLGSSRAHAKGQRRPLPIRGRRT
ncbi:hypothetical protein BC940DRAFT_86566 [Gongronella butleri]|nr:hypothetical protein BC940DRAFT_86566 [Gongronella butleri]